MDSSFVNQYWHRVDLHSHTLNGVTIDGKDDTAGYTHKEFLQIVSAQNLSIKAVTNHNTLHIEDHVKHAILCSMLGVYYIPGVEIDCLVTKKPFHTVFLFDPETDLVHVADKINKYTNDKKAGKEKAGQYKVAFNSKELVDILSCSRFIYIVHAIKDQGLMSKIESDVDDKANQEWVVSSIQNELAAPVLFENTLKYHVYSVVKRIEELVGSSYDTSVFSHDVVTSDYKFDNDSNRKKIIDNKAKYSILSEPTYRGLEIAIRQYKTRFKEESQIIEPTNFIKEISFHPRKDKNFDIGGTIALSPYLNVIIGNSGSGKSLLLNEIYREISGGKNLDISSDNGQNAKKKSLQANGEEKDLYDKKIQSQPFISLGYYRKETPKAKEISKIYAKLLKSTDGDDLASNFGVNNLSETASIISDFKTRVSLYSSKKKEQISSDKDGAGFLSSINSDIRFLLSNSQKSFSPFSLKEVVYDSTNINNFTKKNEEISALLNKKKQYLADIAIAKKLLQDDKDLAELERIFDSLEAKLIALHSKNNLMLLQAEIDKSLTEKLNYAIQKTMKTIGGKEEAVAGKEAHKKSTDVSLFNSLKISLLSDCSMFSIDCSLKKSDIDKSLKDKASSNYARVVSDFRKTDFLCASIDQARECCFLNTNSIVTRISDIPPFDLNVSDSVKKLADFFCDRDLGFDLSDKIVTDKISTITEVNIDGKWLKQNEINPGSLSKAYMSYFFESELANDSPDVVFIDQPENDVDKSFLSDTLSRFIVKHKSGTQFIITTHEPILAVNSDANCVIKARITSNNAIAYDYFDMESKTLDSLGKLNFGTDEIAKTLDGGKKNVIARDQIYGGSPND